jgi:flagellar biosynthetic protein FliR
MAGRLIDVQAGFGLAQVFDPVTRRQVPVVQGAFDKLGVVVFFLLDGHHALVRGIVFSLDRFPLGRAWPMEAAAPVVMRQVAGLFGLGFALAAPVVVCLLAVELAIGVLARNLPQMNLFVIGVPAKVVVVMAVLAIWLGGAGDAMSRIYASIYQGWNAILAEGAR